MTPTTRSRRRDDPYSNKLISRDQCPRLAAPATGKSRKPGKLGEIGKRPARPSDHRWPVPTIRALTSTCTHTPAMPPARIPATKSAKSARSAIPPAHINPAIQAASPQVPNAAARFRQDLRQHSGKEGPLHQSRRPRHDLTQSRTTSPLSPSATRSPTSQRNTGKKSAKNRQQFRQRSGNISSHRPATHPATTTHLAARPLPSKGRGQGVRSATLPATIPARNRQPPIHHHRSPCTSQKRESTQKPSNRCSQPQPPRTPTVIHWLGRTNTHSTT